MSVCPVRCTACPAGHAGTDGLCTSCDPGDAPDSLRTACEACGPGTVSQLGKACTKCVAGKASAYVATHKKAVILNKCVLFAVSTRTCYYIFNMFVLGVNIFYMFVLGVNAFSVVLNNPRQAALA